MQYLKERIEKEAARSDMAEETFFSAYYLIDTQTSDASSQDDMSESLSSRDQEQCVMVHYPCAYFLQSLVKALGIELIRLHMKLADRAYENHKLRIQMDRLL
uniref:AlNc14C272G9972 protein n=1 Tax=Albugo laibachii Nc14 TaxID=890382 RepID=F0WUF2_9STRA|nr:AlNc14C272G9972 [Albugo laibachii Nc14]|eukprot:CCA25032.1 AlNc14C272G9972 [Albugo laibachii Nc14]